MKKLILIFVLLIVGKIGSCQADLGQNTLLLASIDASIKSLTGISTDIAENITAQRALDKLRQAGDAIETMQSLLKLEELLEAMICQLSELKVNISLTDATCISKLKYSICLLNVQLSSDFIKYGLLVKNVVIAFTSHEKMSLLQQAIQTLEKSIEEIHELNLNLRLSFREFMSAKYFKKTFYSSQPGFSISRY
jgi:hypothetical protein